MAQIRFPGISTPQTIPFDRRCCGCRFHGFVTTPNDIIDGDANVGIAFDDCSPCEVTPVRIAIRCIASTQPKEK
jgi:hypothetical protein